MEVKVPFGYGTIWLLITEWVVQRCNQSHAKKGDSLGFGCDELVRIRNSHRTKEVGRRIGLSANQKLSGKLLLKRRRRRNLR
jgi:hypothetical protein